MKIFNVSQINKIDSYTVTNDCIESIDLMERASIKLSEVFVKRFSLSESIIIFAGVGNNGGDALALARILTTKGYNNITTYILSGKRRSKDNQVNLERLCSIKRSAIHYISSADDLPKIEIDNIVVDGLLGSGLNRGVEGLLSSLISHINRSGAYILSIDIPSGLFADTISGKECTSSVIESNLVATFQTPKLSFMFGESAPYVKEYTICDIGLNADYMESLNTPYSYITESDIKSIISKTENIALNGSRFDHKGTYGHALIIAGKYGMMGACILASKACLRGGVGVLTAHIPNSCCSTMQISIPEVVVELDSSDSCLTDRDLDLTRYSAVGIGPGIGTLPDTAEALKALLETYNGPLIMDADAINIVSNNPQLISLIPPNTIITPHPKEFDRLVKALGIDVVSNYTVQSPYIRFKQQIELSIKYSIIVILKGANSSISMPNGTISFNSSGNRAMATAGSGDVLTGVILALLAQGVAPSYAATVGVWLHGSAGDIYVNRHQSYSLIASDLIDMLKDISI